jgi:uncharacterized protein
MWSLNVARIRSAQERFDHVYRAEDFPRGGETFEVAGPVTLGFDVYKDQDRFHLVGGVQATLSLPCSRCLEPFSMPVEAAFDLRYEPRRVGSAGEREVLERDFSAAYYDDQQIDLGQLMSEQFHLALPMKPLCGAGCRGLCPQCGANLNREACPCVRDWHDPRLAALKELTARDPRNH